MDGNILEDGERRSLDDMISEGIKFITGKEKFNYVLAVSVPDNELKKHTGIKKVIIKEEKKDGE